MKIKCARQSTKQRAELRLKSLMEYCMAITQLDNAENLVIRKSKNITKILKSMEVLELKILLTILHDVTSEAAEELSKR